MLTDYDALLWLLDYWQTHYAEMDLPGDRETRAAAVKRMLLREQIDDPETVTVSRVVSLNGEEQRQFAEYCYLAAMSKLDRFRTELELTMLNCIQVTGPESAFPFLQAQREDVRLETDTFCPLGEYWPFHLNLHPGVNEMLTEKANRVYYETVTSTMNPAKEVGGDFYDFFLINNDHLALVLADVSGKGVPAALFMMTSRTMLKDAAFRGCDLRRHGSQYAAAPCTGENRRVCERRRAV